MARAGDFDLEDGTAHRLIELQPTQSDIIQPNTRRETNHSDKGFTARKFYHRLQHTAGIDMVDGGRKPDFFGIVCQGMLKLDVDNEEFTKLVEKKREVLLLSEHAAEIRVATDLYIKKHGSPSAALIAVTSTLSCHQHQELTIVNRLIQSGADLSKTDDDSKSALHHSVRKGYRSVAATLLENEASPLQKDGEGKTPISMALANKDDQMCALLFKYMTRNEIEGIFLRTSAGLRPHYCFQKLIESGSMKETVKVVLDSMIQTGDSFCDEACTAHYAILESDRGGITPKSEGFDGSDFSSFQIISQCGEQELVCHPAMKYLVDRKWRKFARMRFLLGAMSYLFVLLLMTVAVILSLSKEDPAEYLADSPADIIRGICEASVLIMVIQTLVLEVLEAARLQWRYFLDPYNYFDTLSCILLITVVPLRFLSNPTQWPVYSMAYLFSVLRTLKYAAVIRRFRTYIRIMFKMLTMEFGEFMLLFVLTALAFAGSFSLAIREHGLLPSFNQTQASGFGSVFVSALRTAVEASPAIEYYNSSEGDVFGAYCTFLMIVYLFAVMIMLLNILIAQLTDVYDSIRRGAEVEAQITRAWIVSRVELNTFHAMLFRKEQCRIIYYADSELICNSSSSELDGIDLKPRTDNSSAPSNVLEQLNELNIAVRLMGEQLLNQQRHMEELLSRNISKSQ